MIWLVICLGLLALLFLLVGVVTTEAEFKSNAMLSSVVVFVATVIAGVVSCTTVVSAGKVGVVSIYGSVNHGRPLDSGLHLVNPFSTIVPMSIQTENYTMSHQHDEGAKKGDDSVMARSSNGLQMPIDLSVPYRLVPEAAPWVYENLGTDYTAKLLRTALSTAARRAASSYTSEDLYSTKRDEFAEKILVLMESELTKMLSDGYKGQSPPERVLVISQVLVGHVGIPEKVKESIEAKLRADQEQQAMDFTIMREKKEAERKRVEAEGIQAFQSIVTTGISDKLLRWKAIDATLHLAASPNAKVVIIGGGKDALPIILGNAVTEEDKK